MRALQLAICALCLSPPKCLLSMKVEVMNVTITVEEQVAAIITDNCQLCWEILWGHFGVPSCFLCDCATGAVGLLLYYLMNVILAFLGSLSRLSFMEHKLKIVSPKMIHLEPVGMRYKKKTLRQ